MHAACSRSPAWRRTIVEAILDGRQPKWLRLAEMLGNGPLGVEGQRVSWCSGSTSLHSRPVS